MNKNKKGKPFVFPNSFILVIGYIRYSFHLPYRQTEGIINATGKNLPADPPSYGHICKRINKLNVDINDHDRKDDDDDEYIIIAADSTGIKVTNRGQWMDEKWHVQRKGYLKVHVAVNIKTKEILALEVTNEKVHDGMMLTKLVNHVLDKHAPKIESILADGAHDTNRNFRYLEENEITPGIKVRKNSIISIRNNRLRNMEARLQAKDLLKCKMKRKYGNRRIAETAFSTIKRMFGEYVSAIRFENMVNEMMIKVSLYNLFRRI
jgi:transposase